MNSRYKIFLLIACIVCILILLTFNNIYAFFAMLVYGRNDDRTPQKANDRLSKVLAAEFVDELIYYGGEINKQEVKEYDFKVSSYNPELIDRLVAVVNQCLSENECGKVCISCSTSINMPGGIVFGFENYDKSGIIDDYGIVGLYIYSSKYESELGDYMMPERYKNIPNIKYLKIDEGINEIATEQGVDWYEYWPDLIEVEIVE